MTSRGIVTTSIAALCLVTAGCSSSSPSSSGSASATGAASGATASPSASSAASASATSTATGTPAPSMTPPPSSAAAVADTDPRADSVVRVQGKSCAGMAQGAGVFVASDLVVAPDAVTKDAEAIAVHSATGVVRGQVVARDAAHGLSVVKLLPTADGQRLTGTPLTLSSAATGASVTTLGFPVGKHLYSDAGTVGRASQGSLTHTGNPSPGVLGGAVVDGSGNLVGVDAQPAQGTEVTAVDASAIRTLVATAKTSPKAVAFVKCDITGASVTSIHPDGPAIRGALANFINGLSFPDRPSDVQGLTGVQSAWAVLSPSLQKKYGSPAGLQKSFGRTTEGSVDNLEYTDYFTDTLIWAVHVEGPGTKCTVHKQKVVLSSATGTWRVDSFTDLVKPYACEQ